MLRLLALASLAFAAIQGGAAPASSLLHVKVTIVDAEQRPVPLAHHALLVSSNPPTSAPWRIVTGPDGTAEIRLRPGSYTVESDRPTVAQGRAYQWTKFVDVAAGRDTTLELTAAEADVSAATAEMEASPLLAESPTESVSAKWQNSVVALWTEFRHAAGFVVSDTGLVVTSRSAIGDATSLEVQLSAADKVAGQVVVSDPIRDVAVVRIDPAAATGAPPVPLACGSAAADIAPSEDLVAFDVPLLSTKIAAAGAAIAVDAQVLEADFALTASSAGGPVFGATGPAVGLTSMSEDDMAARRGQVRVVRAPAICAVIAGAAQKIAAGSSPSAARLPVEASGRLPADAARASAFSLSPYSSSSSDFDVLFITPVLRAAAEEQERRTGLASDTLSGLRAAIDFGDWSEYVAQSPPVLYIRATPRLVESVWMKFARGAASMQGASIPPIKRVGPGFSRMRVLCGSAEVTPIHPFRIRTRVSDTDAVDEGFYVFDPMAIGPKCGTVSLVLSSVKDPGKTETKVIDPVVIAQVWKDFAAYRDRPPGTR